MNDVEGIFGMFIGLVASSMVLAIPIIYLVLRYRRARRAMDLMHSERMAAIERGMELPPSTLEMAEGGGGRTRTALLPGLMWLFVGLAILGARLSAEFNHPPLFVGLVPIGIGLAYLIYYFIEERKPPVDKSAAATL